MKTLNFEEMGNIEGGLTKSTLDTAVCALGLLAIFSNPFGVVLAGPVSAVCATAMLE